MEKELSLIGLIIGFIVITLKLIFLTIEALNFNLGLFVFFIIFDLFFVITAILTFLKVIKKEQEEDNKDYEIIPFFIILSGALIVYFLTTKLNLDKNIAVGLVAIAFGIFVKKYGPEATLGAFIGAGIFIKTGYFGVILVALVAGFINIYFKNIFKDLGGKLGTTAFIAGIIVFMISDEILGFATKKELLDLIFILLVSLFAALATFILNNELKLGPIISYGIVILLGSIFLLFTATRNLDLSSIVYGAALVGMSKKKEEISYTVIVAASIIFSIFAVVGISFVNVGGRAGLLALISVFMSKEAYLLIKNKRLNIQKDAY